jgi:hypothetical protein
VLAPKGLSGLPELWRRRGQKDPKASGDGT